MTYDADTASSDHCSLQNGILRRDRAGIQDSLHPIWSDAAAGLLATLPFPDQAIALLVNRVF
ncbi:MAG: hypothetical protein CBD74_06275 [Saprospirales bacterium TMED214]|nr:MAG: hypothetical protein CBD74_06275 [Saprospirales bacterium TMED214]